MTKTQMRANHRKVWQWIADHCHEYPNMADNHQLKSLAFAALGLERVVNECFSCEACDLDCYECPCNWGVDMETDQQCEDIGSPYMDFISSDNVKSKKKYALKVKNSWK